MRRRTIVASLSAFALLIASAAHVTAQTPSSLSPSSSSPQTTFTSNSELVMVPVQVMLGGQPVHGLTKDDFTLESDGDVQHIKVFDEFRRSTQVFLPESKPQARSVIPTKFSNLPAQGMPHEIMILAIDNINTIGILRQWAKKQLIDYFQTHRLVEATALVEITPAGLLEFQGPTWDAAALVTALKNMRPSLSRRFDPELKTGLHASLHGGPGEYAMAMANLQQAQYMTLMEELQTTGQTLRSFEQIARAYSAIPGRKTVLWFTTGMDALNRVPDPPPLFGKRGPDIDVPVTSLRHMGKELSPQFRQTLITLNQSSVVLYPIDLAAFPEDRWSWGCASYPPFPYPFGMSFGYACNDAFVWDWATIGEKVVARSTGGEPCDAGNHVKHCIDFAWGESNGYYLLGFYIPLEKRNIGWHDLKVHVRAEHEEVRARSGYYLEAPGPPPKSQQPRALDDAIVAAVEYTGIPFTVEPGKSEAGGATPFKVSVPAGSIATLPGEDKLSFDVVSVAISNHGTPIEGTARITNIDINRDGTQKALADGWQLIDMVSVPRATAAVKVVIRDNLTGRIGSVVFPVDNDAPGGNWPSPKNGAILLLNGSKSN